MSEPRKIIGVALLRNEEYFAFWALSNAVGFCDELIVLDNRSTDGTPGKVEAFKALHPNVTVHRTEDPNTSHRFVEGYAGQDVWVFGVDGDEIYDPEGLARLRSRILGGEFDDYWSVSGYMLHAVEVDLSAGRAHGHTNPHTTCGNKLFNFRALVSWEEPERERLHGRNEKFRPGYSRKKSLDLATREDWESCDLRALHLCFFPRTSVDAVDPIKRQNPMELRANVFRRFHNAVKDFLAAPFSRDAGYKTRKYRRGPVVTREIQAFRRPSRWADHDPGAAQAEAVLEGPAR